MVKGKRVKMLKRIKRTRFNTNEGVISMEYIETENNVGQSVKEIRIIASKYIKNIEDEEKAEQRFKECLLSQGYTRYR